MSTLYKHLPGHYNWNIIFNGKEDSEVELNNVYKSLDGTYTLNPSNPSVQHWSGGGDNDWPRKREIIITEQKKRMVQDALRNGVSRWIDNAVRYINSKDITNEYKGQFPQMYNYLTDRNNIPYESMKRIHYEIVETITKCEESKEVIDKNDKNEAQQKKIAKSWIEYYKKKDYDCNIFFLEIEKNHMKSRELYEEYFTLKNFKQEYNKYNKLYDILYNNNNSDIFLVYNAKKIQNMRGTSELSFLEYLSIEKIQYIKNLIKVSNPISFIGDKIEIEFEEL
jgi:hypothetical protein